MKDDMRLIFPSRSENEGFARAAVAAFAARLDPTLEELDDVRTAVSEAVTNAIIHGYAREPGTVEVCCTAQGSELTVEVTDFGCGMEDTAKAREPFYTSRPDLERSGMGFTVMEAMMDTVEVYSSPGEGTRVVLRKVLGDAVSGL